LLLIGVETKNKNEALRDAALLRVLGYPEEAVGRLEG
jgi:hypothetical protein